MLKAAVVAGAGVVRVARAAVHRVQALVGPPVDQRSAALAPLERRALARRARAAKALMACPQDPQIRQVFPTQRMIRLEWVILPKHQMRQARIPPERQMEEAHQPGAALSTAITGPSVLRDPGPVVESTERSPTVLQCRGMTLSGRKTQLIRRWTRRSRVSVRGVRVVEQRSGSLASL